MLIAHVAWLLLPLVARAFPATTNTTSSADCIISLIDPYRDIRPVCLADLDLVSCERIPVPPQTVLEHSCATSNTQENASCIASAIAKSKATLEEKLKDLKESLAQDGVIPDDFMTFEAWKAGQLQIKRTTEEEKRVELDSDSSERLSGAEAGSEARALSLDTSPDPSADKVEKHSLDTDRPLDTVDTVASSKKATAPQKSPPLAPHRYNYASPDCSARVHSASPQSQHASAVLHKSKDRYMLTPCSAKEHWVIIELCDDIRIEAVEIGMFEFFSGIVKEMRVSIGGADDEDAEEEDKSAWQEVGSFVGRNSRGTQLFTLDYPTSFQRFIRLDFPSHYGNEYYCPISSIKVYGMNQMEAFKWESRKQKELDVIRKRLEADQQRAQQTVTKVATIVASEPDLVSVASSVSHMSFDSSRTVTSTHSPPQRTRTVSHALSASLASSSGNSAYDPVSQAGRNGANTTARVPVRPRPSASPSTSSGASNDGTLQPTKKVETSSSTSTLPTPGSEPSSTKHMKSTSSSADHWTMTHRPVNAMRGLESTDSVSDTQRNVPSPAASIRHEGRADHSESIYAYIIRRLNAVEGNSTLGMMYMEEQTKATRGILQKLENQLAEWKMQMDHSHKTAMRHEVSPPERFTFRKG